jgi:hypothetical protein
MMMKTWSMAGLTSPAATVVVLPGDGMAMVDEIVVVEGGVGIDLRPPDEDEQAARAPMMVPTSNTIFQP